MGNCGYEEGRSAVPSEGGRWRLGLEESAGSST